MLRSSFLRSYPHPNQTLRQLVTGRSQNPFRSFETHLVASRLDRQSARAIECLAHAIEYLEDTRPISAESTPRLAAMEDAVALLKTLNRDVFFSCSTERQRTAARSWTDTLNACNDHHTQRTSGRDQRSERHLAS